MITLMYGIAAVTALWWLSRVFAGANPARMAKLLRRIGGVALLGVAVLLMMRGRLDIAIMVGGLAAWLLGYNLPIPGFGGGSSSRSPGSVSRVRSAMVEMELDHDSGDMNGTVLAGRFASRRLDSLSEPDLQALYRECVGADPEGVRLLEAYFDRRFPGWRQDSQRDADSGAGLQPQSGTMTEEEAYQILGLEPGASVDDVRRAHRLLMKKLHPDQGGSTYLASRVNEAKDVLLSRHR